MRFPARIPDPDEAIAGCRFGPRCPHVERDLPRRAAAAAGAIDGAHRVRCTPRTRAPELS